MEWQALRMRSSRALLEKIDFIWIREWRMPCLRVLSKPMRALMESNSEGMFAWLLCLYHGANRNLVERTIEPWKRQPKRAFLPGIPVNPGSQKSCAMYVRLHPFRSKQSRTWGKLESILQDTCESINMGLVTWPKGLKQTDLTLNNKPFWSGGDS